MNLIGTETKHRNHLSLLDLCKMVLEVPSASLSIIKNLASREKVPIATAQELLTTAIDSLDSDERDQLGKNANIEKYLASGFESDVFYLRSDTGKWVIKIGSNRRFSTGTGIPSSAEYAQKLRRNYVVLQSVFSTSLPYLLPQPYYVLHFDYQGTPVTTQIMPYIDFIKNVESLSQQELHKLRRERIIFQGLSYRMRKNYLLQPDMIKPENLQVYFPSEKPHLVLIDFGLFDLSAPTPILNFLGYCSLLLSFNKDISKIKQKKESVCH